MILLSHDCLKQLLQIIKEGWKPHPISSPAEAWYIIRQWNIRKTNKVG